MIGLLVLQLGESGTAKILSLGLKSWVSLLKGAAAPLSADGRQKY